jgi:Uma2 family endonuclease
MLASAYRRRHQALVAGVFRVRRSLVAVARRMTVDEFLKLPEQEPPLELLAGKVCQKVAPDGQHSWVQYRLIELLNRSESTSGCLRAFPELRTRLEDSILVPDVSVFRSDRVRYQPDGLLARDQDPPDLAIEIASEDQSISLLIQKCLHYVQHGAQLALVVDLTGRRVIRIGTGGTTSVLEGDDRIDLAPLAPELELTPSLLIAMLREQG